MRYKFVLIIVLILLAALTGVFWLRVTRRPEVAKETNLSPLQAMTVPPQFDDESVFLTPIKFSTTTPTAQKVTGISVPHHLLATDIIANAFKFASLSRPDQILLMSPDHFSLGQTDVSVSLSNFSTVFGLLNNDSRASEKLLNLPFVSVQDFYYREHGLGAELPFIKYYFPNAKIIAITIKESAPQDKLNQLVDALKKVLDKNSFVIQSTDFSHYLTPQNAETHDEQTIKALQTGNPKQLFTLNQPDNIDSIAAQYIQMRLQNEFYSAKLNILAHKNSQDYTTEPLTSTTSYIVQAYTKN
ncbi:MAG: AmmeMemoRadiSam system protein B [Candidatus Doudnabacteria bacterium]|nr:AmmeMemoRadiSam system protein B [Candidatus Doudnabacteria bacterium]